MTEQKEFDVIITGGSYSGLAAAMALGRAMRKVLVIDSGEPCNRQTPHSHNFITHDGKPPAEIAALAKKQVQEYPTVSFWSGLVTKGVKTDNGFEIQTMAGDIFKTKKLIFATGIKDILPDIPGIAECWGISVLHCPYCHGYEVSNQTTGILGNGEYGFEFIGLISNWTKSLTLFTNGKSALTAEQHTRLAKHQIPVTEKEIVKLNHREGRLQQIVFEDGTSDSLTTLYTRPAFVHHSTVPESLGCELTEDGFYKADAMQRTTVHGIYVCGDNASRMRTVANAVATGTTAGMMVNREITFEEF